MFQNPGDLATRALKLITGDQQTNIEDQRSVQTENDVYSAVVSTCQLFAVRFLPYPHLNKLELCDNLQSQMAIAQSEETTPIDSTKAMETIATETDNHAGEKSESEGIRLPATPEG